MCGLVFLGERLTKVNCSVLSGNLQRHDLSFPVLALLKPEMARSETDGGGKIGRIRLLVYDFIMSFMWVWSGSLIKLLVTKVLGFGLHEPRGEAIKHAISILNMFFFASLATATRGGSYNPLTVLAAAFSGDFNTFLFTVGARIPTQVVGSITGVRLLIDTFPEVGLGPRLSVDIHWGALTEGLLTFAIVFISIGLKSKIPGGFYMKTWISSVSKLTLHILGSDLTGGCMNPASVMGWAYARGQHITKEHILVYWLAPVHATLLAICTFKLLVGSLHENKEKARLKSE